MRVHNPHASRRQVLKPTVSRSFVALDIETTGLYPIKGRDKIYCVAINDGKKIVVYEDMEKIRALCADPNVCKIIHNAAFDSFWLKMLHGITIVNIWDTRLMEQVIIGETLPRGEKNEALKAALSSSLVYTLKRYGFPSYDKSYGAKFALRPHDKPLTKDEIEYVKNDVRHLLHLQALQETRLTRLDLMRVAGLENSLVESVVAMRARGIGLDVAYWNKNAKENAIKLNEALKRLPPNVDNWNSPAQVKKYFNAKGIPLNTFEDLPDLEGIYNDEVLDKFIAMRKLTKAVTTYGYSWLDDPKYRISTTYDKDCRIRADFEQILNTGRFSCSNPNLQQVPREGNFRDAFVPAKGNVFVIGDFEGQEAGIMAAASKHDLWINAILRGDDIHSLNASTTLHEWIRGTEKGCTFPKRCTCKEHKRLRALAKTNISFAIPYGAGANKLSKRLKISQKDAYTILKNYLRANKRLLIWTGKNADTAVKTRMSYSADPYKRRRTMRDPEAWMLENIGRNNPVQSCGANMIKLAMISLGVDAPLVLQVHDELVLECKKADAKKWAKNLKTVMEKSADYCTGIKGLIKVEPIISKSLKKA